MRPLFFFLFFSFSFPTEVARSTQLAHLSILLSKYPVRKALQCDRGAISSPFSQAQKNLPGSIGKCSPLIKIEMRNQPDVFAAAEHDRSHACRIAQEMQLNQMSTSASNYYRLSNYKDQLENVPSSVTPRGIPIEKRHSRFRCAGFRITCCAILLT
jgi:hypothetical protein